ncbi:MAG: superoxide dismutase family protein [Chloroflexota bacterium]|nr:superoxide dismutase family protein [Chloroflexota bacterium]
MRRPMMLTMFGALLAFLLAMPLGTAAAGEQAGGTLVDGTGKQIGTVQLTQTANAVAVTVSVTGVGTLAPGDHGIHFHAVGKCDGPDFSSAGGHFNPANKQHGLDNPNGPHAGDLPNFTVGASTASQGGYTFTATTSMITLSAGPTSIFDADGTALVIHVGMDDEKTDPAGNSGSRVACAVLKPLATAAPPAPPRTGGGSEAALIRRLGDG